LIHTRRIEGFLRVRALLAGLACLCLPISGPSAALALETAKEIEDCVRTNLPETSSEQRVLFKARDRVGGIKESRATIAWKKFPNGFHRLLLRVSDPPKLRKTGVLLIEKEDTTDRFIYLPALRRVKRITKETLSGPLLGTDFTYEQLERIQGVSVERPSTRLEDGEVKGRPVYVTETRAAEDDTSGYDRVVEFVDRETCVVLRTEFYERGDRLRKVLTVDPADVTPEEGMNIPHRMMVEDLLEESSTEMLVEELKVGKAIPDRVFSLHELSVGRH
jgi:hypothetical protein